MPSYYLLIHTRICTSKQYGTLADGRAQVEGMSKRGWDRDKCLSDHRITLGYVLGYICRRMRTSSSQERMLTAPLIHTYTNIP
jgi:hypothetical protein